MCVNCLRTQVDITEGLQKQATVLWCKDCGRYLQPPKHWLHAEPESKELLTFCLKKLKGLQKVLFTNETLSWIEKGSASYVCVAKICHCVVFDTSKAEGGQEN